jgi:hypothetical protein
MRDLTRALAALAVASLGLFAVACNKGPAEAALQAADQALAAARPEIEKYVPEELGSLTAAAREARSQLEKGHYTDALRAAQGLPAKIQAAAADAAVKKDQLVAVWNEISASLPARMEAITTRVAELAAAKNLPRGMDKAAVAAAQTDLGPVTQGWTEATAAFQGGDVPRAVKTAEDVKAKAKALAGRLGLTAAPAAAR